MIVESLIASVLLAVTPQTAQVPATDLPEVEVLGFRRDEAAAERFVRSVAAPPFGVAGLAIWDRPICLVIDNLRPTAALALRDRIAIRAQSVGVEVAEGDCRMNVLIVATSDGGLTARNLVQADVEGFRLSATQTNLDLRALRHFTDGDDPVRWWTVSLPVDAFSRTPLVVPRGAQAIRRDTPAYSSFGGHTRNVMRSVVVVVDATKTGETPLSSLADYIAFVVLAQVDATTRFDESATILNLFHEGPSAGELTAWDQAYLSALYESPVTWTSVSRHRREIARRMITAGSNQAE